MDGSGDVNMTGLFGGGGGMGSGAPFMGVPGAAFENAGKGRGAAGSGAASAPVRHALACSLEELASGTTKRVKITRARRAPGSAALSPEDKILEVVVKPGWKAGTTVTFERESDETPAGGVPADVTFVIEEKPHASMQRRGDDLLRAERVTLADALCGVTLEVRALDGRTLTIAVPEVITPGYTKVIKGEGMPISKAPGKKGDLLIKFDVVFPKCASHAARHLEALRKAAHFTYAPPPRVPPSC